MANLSTDDFTGSNGSAWSANWTTTGITDLNKTGSTATIQGNKGRLYAGTLASYGGGRAARYSGTNVASCEFIGKFTLTTNIDGRFEVWLRTSTTAVDGTGYVLQMWLGTSSNVVIIRANNYSYTSISTASATITQNTEYGFRFYTVGSSIKYKLWDTSGSEPSSYTSVTDTTVTAAGYSMFKATGGGSAGFIVDLDDVTLTDGTSNQFTYSGSCTSSGVMSRSLVTKGPFLASVTASGAFSYMKVVTRTLTSACTATGSLLKSPIKRLSSSVTPSGFVQKLVPKTLVSSITAAGAFSKSFVRTFSGVITAVGESVTTFAGRVSGKPGIVKVTIMKAGQVRARVRRG